MSASLQNKLQHFETTPPPSVWDKLSKELDVAFVVADSTLSEKLDNTHISPPIPVWDKIAAELGRETIQERKQGKVIPLIFKRIAAAAIAIGLIALGIVYFTGNKKEQQPELVKVIPQQTPTTPGITPQPRIADLSPIILSPESTSTVTTTRNTERPRSSSATSTDVTNELPEFSPEQAPLYELSTVSALQPVSVSAPPLRDKTGNLILDLATISNSDDQYITVTGPNGKQTKISNKFFSCLGYLNGNISASELDSKGIRCTAQFDEWRRRLLSEPAFIPTANNFFDIFELKDLLQEM